MRGMDNFSDISLGQDNERLKIRGEKNSSHSGSSIRFDEVNPSLCHAWRKYISKLTNSSTKKMKRSVKCVQNIK